MAQCISRHDDFSAALIQSKPVRVQAGGLPRGEPKSAASAKSTGPASSSTWTFSPILTIAIGTAECSLAVESAESRPVSRSHRLVGPDR
jgi:hypothetical protein